ncbi:Ctr copper transporter family-domain-containing protein [Lanmaoa asiatica]|nr:Ctr copper transporter family-domain-containing protein [Lanmaoa asiatica]
MASSNDPSVTAKPASVSPSRRSSLNRGVSGSRFIVVMKLNAPPLFFVLLALLVAAGVSGTGKSTLGAALSEALHLPFIDGDDLHPNANVAKMSRGEPLDDADRQPWLDTIRRTAIARVLDQLGVDRGGSERVETDEGLTGYESGVVRGGEARGPSSMRDRERRRPGVIVACSSLKKAYRSVLRGEGVLPPLQTLKSGFSLPTYFVYMKGDRDVLMARMQSRKGHFMKADMLESQLNTLESPEDEPGVVMVSVEMSTREQVRTVVEMFGSYRMDHGGHEGHDMPRMCSMNMLWNTQTIDTCIVFRSWHIRSHTEFVLSFAAIVLLSFLYEYLRLFQRDVDARIRERVNKGKRAASPVSGRSTPERGEETGLLNGRRARHVGRAVIPMHYRTLRAVLYGASVLLSCFLMLVFMTYNAYLIFAVVAGAAIGHYLFSGFVEPESKGMSCH